MCFPTSFLQKGSHADFEDDLPEENWNLLTKTIHQISSAFWNPLRCPDFDPFIQKIFFAYIFLTWKVKFVWKEFLSFAISARIALPCYIEEGKEIRHSS